jgi:hypothetical protein
MCNRPIRISGEDQPERLETLIAGFKTVIVMVESWETKDQAWRCHLRKHPEDNNADIKIFNFAPRKIL